MAISIDPGQPIGKSSAVCNGALLVASRSGEIQFAERQALDWVRRFFGPSKGPRELPRRICRWLETEKRSPRLRSLMAKRKDARLFVRPYRPHPPETIALLLELEEGGGRGIHRKHKGLSAREFEVLRWIAAGKSNSEIGLILGIASATVAKHVEGILIKLGVENRTAAASFYPALAAEKEGQAAAA